MPLNVEDGTGLANADAYVSQANFATYCGNFGYDLTSFSSTNQEIAIRKATDYIDTMWRFKGVKALSSQALEFPRTSLVDWSGNDVTGLPARVVKACCELAFKALSESLHSDLDHGGAVKSESVGPISITYKDDAPNEKQFTAAMKFLAPYIRDTKLVGSPVWVEPDYTGIEIDDHANNQQ